MRRARGSWAAAVAVAALLVVPAVALGIFTKQATNPQTATADIVVNWLRQYSSATDPAGTTGYALRLLCSTTPAATGSDTSLVVNTGGLVITGLAQTLTQAWTIKTPASFPEGQTTATATITLTADPTSGKQPISLATIGLTGLGTQAMAPNTRYAVNLVFVTSSLSLSQHYYPTAIVTISFTGESSGFLRYVVPVNVWTGTGCG